MAAAEGALPGPAAAPVGGSRRRTRWVGFLAVAVVAALTLFIGMAIVRGGSNGNTPDALPVSGGVEPRGSPSATPEATTQAPLGDQDGPEGWAAAARGFGHAFTRTAVGQDAWFAAMSTWLTPEQARRYRGVPIHEIPGGVLQEVTVAEPAGTHSTHGQLRYDTGMVLNVGLSYSATEGGWLVARVTLAEPAHSP